jgi:hypothetical protein
VSVGLSSPIDPSIVTLFRSPHILLTSPPV